LEIFNTYLLEQKPSSGLESLFALFRGVSNKANFTHFNPCIGSVPASWNPCSSHDDLPVPPKLLSSGGHKLRTQNLVAAGDSPSCTVLVLCYQTELAELKSIKSRALPTEGAAIPKPLLRDASPTCF